MADQRELQEPSSLPDSFKAVRDYLQDSPRELCFWNAVFRATELLPNRQRIRDPHPPDLVEEEIRHLLDLLLSRTCPCPDSVFRIVRLIQMVRCGEGLYGYMRASLRGNELWYKSGMAMRNLDNEMKYLTTVALQRCDEQFLQVLISYGLVLRLPMIHDSELLGLWGLCSRSSPRYDASLIYSDEVSSIPWSDSKMYGLLKRHNGRMLGRNRRSFERISLIVRLQLAATLKRYGEETMAKSYAAVVQMYVDTLPDPLVTSEEFREFQCVRYRKRPDIVDRTVQAFVELFGDQQAYEPRRLTHLCRCTIREIIVSQSSVSLPAAVKSLDLPRATKDFVLMDPGWSARQKQ